MKFKVLLHKRVYEFLKSLSLEDRHRLIDGIRDLEDFQKVRLDIVKIAGEKDTLRLRVGDYIVLFKVYERKKITVIVKIDIRRRVYR